MKILLIKPLEPPIETGIDGTLESMQKTVGGCIEVIYPFDDDTALVCNDEGKLNGLPLNRAIKDQDGEIYDIIAGTFFVPLPQIATVSRV